MVVHGPLPWLIAHPRTSDGPRLRTLPPRPVTTTRPRVAREITRSAALDLARRLFRLALGARLPLTSGTTTVGGIQRPVTIRRDAWHVPHIEAATDDDAFYGLGFCQGQDRAFQIETFKRVARGTLSILVGETGLAIDRLTRRLGLHHRAADQLANLRDDLAQRLEAFAAGVTDGVTVGSPRPAHEFTLLRAEPTPLTARDVVAMLKLHSFLLAGNWETELARLQVLVEDGEEALRALDLTYAAHLPVTAPPGRSAGPAVERLATDLAALRDRLGLQGASNNWVVAGSRTASGRPLVANDPHLPPTLPPLWYLAHLSTPDWSLVGAAFAGTPGVAAGHNGHGAWGVTAAHSDNTDLFLEEIVGDDAVRDDGATDGVARCEVRREVIAVRGGEDVVEQVLVTPRGPIVGPALAGAPTALSIAGTWLDDAPSVGLLDVATARDFETFRHRFEQWPGMQLNVVWADVSGTIGWQMVGELPIRRGERGAAVPQAGWDPDAGWTDERVPFAKMPSDRDPDLGLIATANNKPVRHAGEDDPFLGLDWLEGYRVAAIVDALHDRDDWDVDATLRLQVDQRSIPWLEMRAAVLGVTPTGTQATRAHVLLNDWDGRVEADAPGAAVYELFHADMVRRIVEAKAPTAAAWMLGAGFHDIADHSILGLRRTSHLIDLLRERPDGWFDESWDDVVNASLRAAVAYLESHHGPDPHGWGWGTVRPLTLRHPVGRVAAPLARVFDRGPFPWGGDAHTIPQASPPPLHPTEDPIAIASLRMVVDVGAFENSRWVLPGGQSGNPVSPHYDDQLPLWRAADGIPIPFGDQAVRDACVTHLRLLPVSPG